MAKIVDVRCGCGTLSGKLDLSAHKGFMVRCYCRSCRTFAEKSGHGEVMLDKHGGTDIYQTSPAALVLSTGQDQLACLRLTSKGPLRWYAKCCGKPIANTMANAQIPFTGLIAASIKHTFESQPVGIFARDALTPPDDIKTHEGLPIPLLVSTFVSVLRRRLAGHHRQSPFFDPTSGEPVAQP